MGTRVSLTPTHPPNDSNLHVAKKPDPLKGRAKTYETLALYAQQRAVSTQENLRAQLRISWRNEPSCHPR